MLIVGHFFYVQLLLFLFSQAESIRPLKQGRMVDAEGREYKSPRYESDGEEKNTYSQVSGTSPVHIRCTDSSMIVEVNPDHFKRGRLVSLGALFLGGAQHWQNSMCHLSPAANGLYVVTIKLHECGSKSTVKHCVTCNIKMLSCLTKLNHSECTYFSAGGGGLSDLLKQAVSGAAFKSPEHHQVDLCSYFCCLPL